jgi:hypothetical protein
MRGQTSVTIGQDLNWKSITNTRLLRSLSRRKLALCFHFSFKPYFLWFQHSAVFTYTSCCCRFKDIKSYKKLLNLEFAFKVKYQPYYRQASINKHSFDTVVINNIKIHINLDQVFCSFHSHFHSISYFVFFTYFFHRIHFFPSFVVL